MDRINLRNISLAAGGILLAAAFGVAIIKGAPETPSLAPAPVAGPIAAAPHPAMAPAETRN